MASGKGKDIRKDSVGVLCDQRDQLPLGKYDVVPSQLSAVLVMLPNLLQIKAVLGPYRLLDLFLSFLDQLQVQLRERHFASNFGHLPSRQSLNHHLILLLLLPLLLLLVLLLLLLLQLILLVLIIADLSKNVGNFFTIGDSLHFANKSHRNVG